MNAYRILIEDVEWATDIGRDDCELIKAGSASGLVLAEMNAKASYRGLRNPGLLPGQYDLCWPPKVSCVCTKKNVSFQAMYDRMDVSEHEDWRRTEKEVDNG